MVSIIITQLFINSYIILTLLLCNYTGFSVRIGSILNTHYTTSVVDQIYFNMTCIQCSCAALNTNAVGWNCLINNYTCQLIRNYSLSDVGFKKMNNTIFYFQNFPSTVVNPTTPNYTCATLRWNQTFTTIAGIKGKSGSNATMLNKPNGITIDPTTLSIFITDKDNNRVQKFLPGIINGLTVGGNSSGKSGSTNNLLDEPITSAWLNTTGTLFIADNNNHRIMRLLPSNTSLAAIRVAGIGSNGASLSELNNPSGVAVDKHGTYLYVADRENHRILRWNLMNLTLNGVLIAGITGVRSNRNNTLEEPHSLVLNQQDTVLYIADRDNNRIQKLTLSTGIITTAAGNPTGSSGSNTYELDEPEAIALDSLDNLYVADKKNNRIQMFCNNSRNGTDILKNVILDEPCGIAIDASFNLYVSDTYNHRVLKFTPLP